MQPTSNGQPPQMGRSLSQHIRKSLDQIYSGVLYEWLTRHETDRVLECVDEILLPLLAEDYTHLSVKALLYALASMLTGLHGAPPPEAEPDSFQYIATHTSSQGARYLRDSMHRFLRAEPEGGEELFDTIQRLKSYIDHNLGSDLSLTALSERGFLNPSYLSRYFKKETGFNITDYVLQKRIGRALQELLETQKSIQDISRDVGFNTPQYFSSTFKKAVGLSPQAYRHKKSRY